MFTQTEKDLVLEDFPNIKLSYENITHKKVYNSDMFLAIPEGKKCFAWFTEYKEQNACIIMELSGNNSNKIDTIRLTNASFVNELIYGTILYGTIFYHVNNRFFSIEDIFYYKGNDVSKKNWFQKFSIIQNMMEKEIKQVSFNRFYTLFGLPVFSSNYNDFLVKLSAIKYKINSIQYRLFNKSNCFLYSPIQKFIQYNNPSSNKESHYKNNHNLKEKREREKIFQIKPDIQNDIYHLYCYNNDGKYIYYNTAHIPDFTTSVMMNKLFRNIKENANLDALEESDEEEEFENYRLDKFVYLEKVYNMYCVFNYKFKKWQPLKIASQDAKIVLLTELNK